MASQPHGKPPLEGDRLSSDERLQERVGEMGPAAAPAPRFAGDLAALRSRLARGRDLLPAARPHGDEDLFPTAIPAVDALLGGGLPRGCLTELRGAPSTGRLSLVLALLAAATARGEAAALVDLGDHLDPQAAESAGVDLSRLLWARPRRLRDALAAAEIALGGAFPLVVLELGGAPLRGKRDEHAWLRLARAARHHRGALLVATPYRTTGSAAAEVLALSRRRGVWLGAGDAPRLLAGVESRLEREKSRRLPQPAAAALAWRAPSVVAGAQPMPARQLSLTMSAPPSAGLRAARAAAAEAAAKAPLLGEAPAANAPIAGTPVSAVTRARRAVLDGEEGREPSPERVAVGRAAAVGAAGAKPAAKPAAAKRAGDRGAIEPGPGRPGATKPLAARRAVAGTAVDKPARPTQPAAVAPASAAERPARGKSAGKAAAVAAARPAAASGRPQPLPDPRLPFGTPWPPRRRVPRWVPLARAALADSMRPPAAHITERAVPAPPSARDRRV